MSTIYSFLQKKKVHESQHGIVMVITAYVLSFVMLVLGSDVFYNINSTAAGIGMKSDEATQNSSIELIDQQMLIISSQIIKEKLVHPYGLTGVTKLIEEVQAQNQLSKKDLQRAVIADETNWLFGQALNRQEYDAFMTQLSEADSLIEQNENEIVSALNDKSSKTTKSAKVEEDMIESFSVDDKTKTKIMSVTKDEMDMLVRIVEAEATGEDMKGKILVANVIFNRVHDEDFPDTIEDVIFQKVRGDYQFSPVKDERFWSVKVTKETKEAVERALQGEDHSKGALYFMARKRTAKSSASWFDKKLQWLFKHGGHEFYKNK